MNPLDLLKARKLQVAQQQEAVETFSPDFRLGLMRLLEAARVYVGEVQGGGYGGDEYSGEEFDELARCVDDLKRLEVRFLPARMFEDDLPLAPLFDTRVSE